MDATDALHRAVEHVGSQAELGRRIGCSQPFIHFALRGEKRLSLETAFRIESATDGEVRAEELRPDLAKLIGGRSGTAPSACAEP